MTSVFEARVRSRYSYSVPCEISDLGKFGKFIATYCYTAVCC